MVLAFLAGAVLGGLVGGVGAMANEKRWADCAALRPVVDSLGRELDIAQWYANRSWNDLARVQRACVRRRR